MFKKDIDLETSPLNTNQPIFLHRKMREGDTWVYIWYSRNKGGDGVGHIALEFCHHGQEYYISFWPEKITLKKTTFGNAEPTHWSPDRYTDFEYEGRIPEYAKKITGLNTQKMHETYLQLKEKAKNWGVFGNTLDREERISFNCIEVAATILKVGGIENLAKERFLDKSPDKTERIDKVNCCTTFMTYSLALSCCCIVCPSIPALMIIGGIETFHPDTVPIETLYFFSACFLLGVALNILSWLIHKINCICKNCCPSNPISKLCPITTEEEEKKENYYRNKGSSIGWPITERFFQNTGNFTGDIIQGLADGTLVPDGRIQEIIDKAIANTQKSSLTSVSIFKTSDPQQKGKEKEDDIEAQKLQFNITS